MSNEFKNKKDCKRRRLERALFPSQWAHRDQCKDEVIEVDNSPEAIEARLREQKPLVEKWGEYPQRLDARLRREHPRKHGCHGRYAPEPENNEPNNKLKL